ncbi:hypothetical protein [Ramlibacter sp. Leaf400]|uniref:hypothetical protein n=1 Tax=Ramlibacter sp. Leaf400 TaxID=1736365 RepID=UPI002E1625EE
MSAATALAQAPAALRVIPVREVRAMAARPQQATLCSTCHLKDLCLPCDLAEADVQRLDGLMFGRRRCAAAPSSPSCSWPTAASRSAASTWPAS